MNKSEQVSNLGHQMSLVGGPQVDKFEQVFSSDITIGVQDHVAVAVGVLLWTTSRLKNQRRESCLETKVHCLCLIADAMKHGSRAVVMETVAPGLSGCPMKYKDSNKFKKN